MNSPTEERWKKPKLDKSWAEASCTAGAVPFRRIAIEKSFILVMGEYEDVAITRSGLSQSARPPPTTKIEWLCAGLEWEPPALFAPVKFRERCSQKTLIDPRVHPSRSSRPLNPSNDAPHNPPTHNTIRPVPSSDPIHPRSHAFVSSCLRRCRPSQERQP